MLFFSITTRLLLDVAAVISLKKFNQKARPEKTINQSPQEEEKRS